jgi:hypothetical protein
VETAFFANNRRRQVYQRRHACAITAALCAVPRFDADATRVALAFDAFSLENAMPIDAFSPENAMPFDAFSLENAMGARHRGRTMRQIRIKPGQLR